MYVYICVQIHECMYGRMPVRLYLCMYVCMYGWMDKYKDVCMCMCVFVCVRALFVLLGFLNIAIK